MPYKLKTQPNRKTLTETDKNNFKPRNGYSFRIPQKSATLTNPGAALRKERDSAEQEAVRRGAYKNSERKEQEETGKLRTLRKQVGKGKSGGY